MREFLTEEKKNRNKKSLQFKIRTVYRVHQRIDTFSVAPICHWAICDNRKHVEYQTDQHNRSYRAD